MLVQMQGRPDHHHQRGWWGWWLVRG